MRLLFRASASVICIQKIEIIKICRDFLKLFKTDELMQWKNLTSMCEKEFRDGLSGSPATGAFDRTSERGNKRWDDFKKRVVEHVSRLGRNTFSYLHKPMA